MYIFNDALYVCPSIQELAYALFFICYLLLACYKLVLRKAIGAAELTDERTDKVIFRSLRA